MAAAAEIALIIGIIGNVTSVMVYASPIPTFWYIYKKKSTEYFSPLPYVCTLLTVQMGLYYGCIKENGMLIITINVIGLTFETIYLAVFLTYAAKFSRIRTIKQVVLDLVFFGVSVLLTLLFTDGKTRVLVVGSLCSAVAICMYAAPLSIIRLVIRTKNVDFMPVALSTFLAINASLWSAYSFFARDIFIGIPSALGSLLALTQVALYIFYKNAKKPDDKPLGAKNNNMVQLDHQQEQQHTIDIPSESIDSDNKIAGTGKVADEQQQHQVELTEKTGQ